MRNAGILAGVAVLAILPLALPAHADTEIRRVTGGVSSLTLVESQLAAAGLALDRVETTGTLSPAFTAAGARHYGFAVRPDDGVTFRVVDGAFAGFGPGVTVAHRGGFVLVPDARANVREIALQGLVLRPGSLREQGFAMLGAGEGDAAFPFEIRSATPAPSAAGGLVLLAGDVVVAPEFARAIGRPDAAGDWIGSFDFRWESELVRREAAAPGDALPAAAVTGIDVLLKEVYGMDDLGRIGTYPTGTLGLSFNTTSCNNGSVNVPWYAPMAENHPFIGLAMFREKDGRFEQIGRSWTKHGFYALASDQCALGCIGGGGGTLNVGCSDTYSIANNGSQYYLGARDEVNPHTAVWHCLGSWFDGTPVDCIRSNDGSGLSGVAHRLEVRESDLLVPGARYFYEGVYWVMDDVDRPNNYGWRECVPTWNGTAWLFPDVGGGVIANPGPAILAWGGQMDSKDVAADDGTAVVANRVTDLGGGMWHYEYVVYNQSCARGIERFEVPVGAANVTNAGFRDIDLDAGNEWGVTIADGRVAWATGTYGGAPVTNPIKYQSVFNFRFDADAAPVASTARIRLHAPGVGDAAFFVVRAPHAGATGAPEPVLARSTFELSGAEPNPFAASTRVTFALGEERPVRLLVVDVTGRVVRTLLDGAAPSGRTSLVWNGRDERGADVASGIYFFRLVSGSESRTAKGILLR